MAYNQARRHPFSRISLDDLRQSTVRIQENNLDTILALAQRTFGAAYQFVPPMSVTLGMQGMPVREEGPRLQRHRRLEADRAARGAVRPTHARIPDDAAAGAPGRADHGDRGDRARTRSASTRSGTFFGLRRAGGSASQLRALIGVGGIGAGHRSSARRRPRRWAGTRAGRAALLDQRDYCKLHIIATTWRGSWGGGVSRRTVLPVGAVGTDDAGRRLVTDMKKPGMDVRHVQVRADAPTELRHLLHVPRRERRQRHDGRLGGGAREGARRGPRGALALSGLSSRSRRRGAARGAPPPAGAGRARRAPCVPRPSPRPRSPGTETGLLSLVDVLSLNQDEAAALAGEPWPAGEPRPFLDRCADALRASQPAMRAVVTAGARGASRSTARSERAGPARPRRHGATAGAGGALPSGGWARGWPCFHRTTGVPGRASAIGRSPPRSISGPSSRP